MDWLINIDTALLRIINVSLRNPLFDAVMPFLSGNKFFMPAAVLCGALILWRWKWRGLLIVALIGAGLAIGDGVVYPALKSAIGRMRPYHVLSEVVVSAGKSSSLSMPSSHAANWFCLAVILGAFVRRSLWITLPLALLVSLSRVYNGMHYPGDVLAGALVGAGCGSAVLLGASLLWTSIGRNLFPLWWERFPSLFGNHCAPQDLEEPEYRARGATGPSAPRHATLDAHWLRLGYLFLILTCAVRLLYIASGTLQLTPDEAYQWHWSKHLDISYYSKPPLIAYTQWLGTTIWGDSEFGVRFFSPVLSTILGLIVLRFFAREVNARAGFFLLVILTTAPMIAAGGVLMTVDPLSVLFWTCAMISGWKAVKERSTTGDWLWVGLWMGLGFLSKYTALFQLLSFALFFVLWPPARKHLGRKGVWVSLLLCLVCTAPVVFWNYRHDWVTVFHVVDDAGAGKSWKPWKYFPEFIGAEFGLLNPVYFVAVTWAAIAMWKRRRNNPLLVYLFCMGAPIFAIYLMLSFKSRVEPNWIVPAVIPFFCLAVIYWDARLRLGQDSVRHWLTAGICLGTVAVVFAHNTDLTEKVFKLKLPPKSDPLRRAHAWPETVKVVEQQRRFLLTEGKPVFVIGDNYGITSELSFYYPENRERASTNPLVYRARSKAAKDQYFFWPAYENRLEENAVFVRELNPSYSKTFPAPTRLVAEFESVEEAGVFPVHRRKDKDPTRYLQIFKCRGLRSNHETE